MSNSQPSARKRRWFQFHLSTALAVMLAAGFLLFLNMRVGEYRHARGPKYAVVPAYGWPKQCYFQFEKMKPLTPEEYMAENPDLKSSEFAAMRMEIEML